MTLTIVDSLGQSASIAHDVVVSQGPIIEPPPIDNSTPTNTADQIGFLYQADQPIQTGVDESKMEPEHIALVRGRVLDRQNQPIVNADVSVIDHLEFGSTTSQDDGWFSMAVNGGNPLRLRISKDGYLPAERTTQPKWDDSVVVDEVVLIALDVNSTAVALNTIGSGNFAVATGTTSQDDDGERTSTLLVPDGVSAQLINPNGSTTPAPTTPAPTLTIRQTEYTVGENGPEAMPAALPPTSAYTYAFELSADEALQVGATGVSFNKPLWHYNDNFLEFPAGTVVPNGYFDSQIGAWVPAENGLVIKVLGVSAGVAQVDITGDDVPDTGQALANIELTTAELTKIASLYSTGKSLWRSPIRHFSTWDSNWGIAPPSDAESLWTKLLKQVGRFIAPNCFARGSDIGCENQSVGESVGINGTGLDLNYNSARQLGSHGQNQIDLQVSNETVPPSLAGIVVETTIAGRKFTGTLSADPNQHYSLSWDGLDAFGRQLQGAQNATVRVGYVYNAQYKTTERFGYTGNGTFITANAARTELTLWGPDMETTVTAVTVNDARGIGLGGWAISGHNAYDPRSQVLASGDGSLRQTQPLLTSITAFAGVGELGFSGDGGQAKAAKMRGPGGIVTDGSGNTYVSDTYNDRIRKIDPEGTITTVAGTGLYGYSGDGGAATSAQLASPLELSLDGASNLYVADVDNHRVRKIDAQGIITTVAGTGVNGSLGDGGLATSAQLSEPTGVVVDSAANLFISEYGGHRIRKVTPDGFISTYAGLGTAGFSGDGSQAIAAQLNQPSMLAIDRDGTLYIADSANERIRRVNKSGVIDTFVGNGTHGYSGEFGQAHEFSLGDPSAIALDDAGDLIIGDRDNERILRVDSSGAVSTIAGSGVYGSSGDDGPATKAQLGNPRSVTVNESGQILIADADNNRIRKVGPPLPSRAVGSFSVPNQDGTELFEFDAAGRHIKTFDTLSGALKVSFSYDSAGRLTELFDPFGNHTVIERDLNGVPTAIVAPFGQRTTLVTNADGYLTSIANENGESVAIDYFDGGLIKTFTDPARNASSYTYDQEGKLTSSAGRDGLVTTLVASALPDGIQVLKTTPMGRTTTYKLRQLPDGAIVHSAVQANGKIEEETFKTDGTKVLNVEGVVTTMATAGDPRWAMAAPNASEISIAQPGQSTLLSRTNTAISLTDPTNPLSVTSKLDSSTIGDRSWTSSYNGTTRTLLTSSPEGRHSTITFDQYARVVSEQIGDFAPVSYHYDSRGRVDSATQGSGLNQRVTAIAYNADGWVDHITGPDAQQASFTYDSVGRVLSATGPGARTSTSSYDENGDVASITPPGASAYEIGHNAEQIPSSFSPPALSGGGSYGYETNNDLQYSSYTQADGTHVTFNYNPQGQLSAIVSPSGQHSFNFDSSGRFASTTSMSGVTQTVGYTGVIPTGTTYSGALSGTVSSTFDNEMRLTSESVNANTVTYSYDRDGLLNRAGDLNIARNGPDGYVNATSIGQIASSMSVDNFGQQTSFSSSASGAVTYSETMAAYDKLARIIDRTEVIDGVTSNYHYSYDPAGRLSSVSVNGTEVSSYTYDANNNRSVVTRSATTLNATYDSQDRLLTQGTLSFTYNPDGQLTSKTDSSTSEVTNYHYELNKLVGVDLPDGRHISYVTDSTGNTVLKKVNGTTTQGLLYDGDSVVGQTNSSGNLVSRFVYGTRATTPDYFTKEGHTYRIITDHLGSVRQVIDTASGSIAQRIDYDEYGRVTEDSAPGFQPFGYGGGIWDDNTKLVHFGSRDYDPELARFIEKDSIGFAGGLNAYVYVDGDPINNIDPTGNDPIGCFQDLVRIAQLVPGPISIAATAILLSVDLARGNWGDAVFDITGIVPLGRARTASKALTNETKSTTSRVAEKTTQACSLNSFSADTKVLMADGTTKEIKDINTTDQVLATDTSSGKTTPRSVTATMSNDDDDLLDLSIKDSTGNQGVIKTTDHHKIWSITANNWVLAEDLKQGDLLREPNGTQAQLTKLTSRPGHQEMLDLTVDVDHSFYVIADGGGSDGSVSNGVLVHNESCGSGMLGAGRPQITSLTLGGGKGWRIDVENPAPGSRPGQLHLQMGRQKYLYDFETDTFVGASKTLNKKFSRNRDIQEAILSGKRYLGVGK